MAWQAWLAPYTGWSHFTQLPGTHTHTHTHGYTHTVTHAQQCHTATIETSSGADMRELNEEEVVSVKEETSSGLLVRLGTGTDDSVS